MQEMVEKLEKDKNNLLEKCEVQVYRSAKYYDYLCYFNDYPVKWCLTKPLILSW